MRTWWSSRASVAGLVVVLVGCGAGCTAGPAPVDPASSTAASPAGAGPSASSPAAGAVARADGGCGRTPVVTGPPPAWNPRPAGYSDVPDQSPYVVGVQNLIMGYLWAFPLRAGHPDNPSNKILWYVRLPRNGDSLIVHAHPRGAGEPTISYRLPADSSPGEIYPSGLDVPNPGCWTFTLTWGTHTDQVDLHYA